jgi:hypothetical protein
MAIHETNSRGRQPDTGRPVSRTTKNFGIAVLVTVAAISAAACGRTTGTQSSPSSSPTSNAATAVPSRPTTAPVPRNIEQLCRSLTWPRPIPAVIGLIFDDNTDELQPFTCLDNVRGIRPDGSIDDPHERPYFNGARSALIVSVSPPPGTLVGPNDAVTVNLDNGSVGQKPESGPCDWVSPDEASRILGQPADNRYGELAEPGSTELRCTYSNQVDRISMVTSELLLTGGHIVDAASEYAFKTGDDSTSVSGVGIKAACVPPPFGSTQWQFYVLLPGEKIYVASGRQSCDTLKQFAQAAIPRIGG